MATLIAHLAIHVTKHAPLCACAVEGDGDSDVEVSQHDDHCAVCHKNDHQDMLLCDGCPKAFHLSCLGLEIVPEGDWYCAICSDAAVNQ